MTNNGCLVALVASGRVPRRLRTLGVMGDVANNAPLQGVLQEGAAGEIERFLMANAIQVHAKVSDQMVATKIHDPG